jgi:nitroreductase
MQQRRSVRDFSDRPRNEHPYVLFPVGYPAKDADVPDLERKPLANIVQWNR